MTHSGELALEPRCKGVRGRSRKKSPTAKFRLMLVVGPIGWYNSGGSSGSSIFRARPHVIVTNLGGVLSFLNAQTYLHISSTSYRKLAAWALKHVVTL